MWLSLQGKDCTEIFPTVSLLPLGYNVKDEFSDVDSLMGMAGPILLQVSTFSSCRKGVCCPVSTSTCEKRSSPTQNIYTYYSHINTVQVALYPINLK